MKSFKEISARLEIARRNIKKGQIENKSSNAASLGKALKISTELVCICSGRHNIRVYFGQLV